MGGSRLLVLRSAQDLPNPSWQSHAPARHCSGFTFMAGITRKETYSSFIKTHMRNKTLSSVTHLEQLSQ